MIAPIDDDEDPSECILTGGRGVREAGLDCGNDDETGAVDEVTDD